MSEQFSINIKSPQTQALKLEQFGGVDLTNSTLYVAPNRASKMLNFIKRNNVNEKRFGWTEILQFEPLYKKDAEGEYELDSNGNKIEVSSANINGVWQFDTSFLVEAEGTRTWKNEHHIIVMVGRRFYRVSEFKNNSSEYLWLNESQEITNELIQANNKGLIQEVRVKDSVINKVDYNYVKDEIAYGVASGNRLYILCGDYLVYGSWDNGTMFELRQVYNDSETYIPTTTKSIVALNSGYDLSNINTRMAYDDENMLTSKRKNTFLGNIATDANNQANVNYLLDRKIKSGTTPIVRYKSTSGWVNLTITTDFTLSDYNQDGIETTQLTILANKAPLIEGEDNIEVEFEIDNEEESFKIRECKFGKMYGSNGIRDRLFVSGNEDYPNYDWHSTETNNGNDGEQDLTYFSPLDYCKYGNTTNKIMGYEILGDGRLLIMKSTSSQEPSIYTREAKLVQAIAYDGTIIEGMYEEAYPLSVGNTGEGVINMNGIKTLNGEALMVSNNGVYGIVLGNNVATSQRYARERSRLINGEITKHDLSQASCIVHDNKYYLSIEDKCYIADSRFTFRLEDDLSNTYQYEWWVWDNIPSRLFFTDITNTLYFGTKQGHICAFRDKNYVDTTYANLDNGEITYSTETKLFTISPNHINELENLHENDTYTITEEDTPIYAVLLNIGDYSIYNGKIKINTTIDKQTLILYQNLDFYLDNITTSGTDLLEDTKYTIVYYASENTIELNKNSVAIELTDTDSFRLCFKVPTINRVCEVQDSNGLKYKNFEEDNGKYYRLDNYGIRIEELANKPKFNKFKISSFSEKLEPLNIVQYKGTSALNNFGGYIEFREIVGCLYVTPVFDLGTTIYSKNIKSLVITPDALLGSRVEFGYETRKTEEPMTYELYTGQAFSFSNLSFESISFESNTFAKSWIKKVKIKKVNFIRFIFKNSSDDNCKINNLTITYTLGQKNKGVN